MPSSPARIWAGLMLLACAGAALSSLPVELRDPFDVVKPTDANCNFTKVFVDVALAVSGQRLNEDQVAYQLGQVFFGIAHSGHVGKVRVFLLHMNNRDNPTVVTFANVEQFIEEVSGSFYYLAYYPYPNLDEMFGDAAKALLKRPDTPTFTIFNEKGDEIIVNGTNIIAAQYLVVMTSSPTDAQTAIQSGGPLHSLWLHGVQTITVTIQNNKPYSFEQFASPIDPTFPRTQSVIGSPLANKLRYIMNADPDPPMIYKQKQTIWPDSVPASALLTRLLQGPGYTCVSFPHIITFDSNVYAFEEVGDFYLMRADLMAVRPDNTVFSMMETRMQVQVRRGLCHASQSNGAGSKRVVCNRGFAILATEVGVLSFTVDPTEGGQFIVKMSINGEAPTPLRPIHSGYNFAVDVRERNNALEVTVSAHDGVWQLDMRFTAAGGMIAFPALPMFFNSTSGLCGNFNGQPADDLTPLYNQTAPPKSGVDSSALAAFAKSYRVLPSASLFYNKATQPEFTDSPSPPEPIVTATSASDLDARDPELPHDWVGDYSSGDDESGDCAALQSAASKFTNAPAKLRSFLYDACRFDVNHHVATLAHLVKDFHCQKYCRNGFSMPTAVVFPEDCTCRIDEFMTAKRNLSVVYDNVNLPPVQVLSGEPDPTDIANCGKGTPELVFREQHQMGGQFLIQVNVTDLCGEQTRNLTVDVACANQLAINSITANPSSVSISRYGFPAITLSAAVQTSKPIIYQWRFPWNFAEEDTPVPVLLPNSVSPSVYFYPPVAANYTIELSVSDGCSVKRKNLTIQVSCRRELCQPTAVISPAPPVVYRYGSWPFPTRQLYGTKSRYRQIDEMAVGSYNWTLEHSRPMARVYDRPNHALVYTILAPLTTNQTYNITESTTDTTSTSTTSQAKPTRVAVFKDVTDTVYNDYSWTVTETKNTTTVVVTNKVIRPIAPTLCKLTLQNPFNNPRQYPSLQASLDVTPTLSPKDCVGTYGVRLEVGNECYKDSDSMRMTVRCSRPMAKIMCLSNTVYYRTRAELQADLGYSALNFDARYSYDEDGNGFAYRWAVDGVDLSVAPNTRELILSNSDLTRLTVGEHNVTLTIDNGCEQAKDSFKFTLKCEDPVKVQAVLVPLQPTYTFAMSEDAAAREESKTPRFTAQNSVSPDNRDAKYIFDYNLEQTSSFPNGSFFNPAYGDYSFAFTPATLVAAATTNPNRSIANAWAGSYKVRMQYASSCNKSDVTATATVSCGYAAQNAWQFSQTPTGTVTVYYNGTTGQTNPVPISNVSEWAINYANGQVLTLSSNYSLLDVRFRVQGSHPSSVVLLEQGSDANKAQLSVTIRKADSAPLFVPTDYRVETFFTDFCDFRSPALITISPKCQNPPSSFGVTLAFSDNDTITASVTWNQATIAPPNRFYFNVTVNDVFDPQSDSSNDPVFQFVAKAEGMYKVTVTGTDGCFTVAASNSIKYSCPVVTLGMPGAQSVGFASMHGMQQVYLQASPTTTVLPTPMNTFDYDWEVISAPANSEYAPRQIVTRYNTTIETSPATIAISGLNETTTTTTTYTTLTTINDRRVFIPRCDTHDPLAMFPACFRPDVSGTYKFRITVTRSAANAHTWPACRYTAVQEVSMTCNAVPNLDGVRSVVTPTVDRNDFTRVQLDAQGAWDKDNDTLSFLWTLDEDSYVSGTILEDAIHEHTSAVASIVLKSAAHPIKIQLNVSDGCSVVTKLVTVAPAGCQDRAVFTNPFTVSTLWDGSTDIETLTVAHDSNLYADMNKDGAPDAAVPSIRCNREYKYTLIGYSEQTTYRASAAAAEGEDEEDEEVSSKWWFWVVIAVAIVVLIALVIAAIKCCKRSS